MGSKCHRNKITGLGTIRKQIILKTERRLRLLRYLIVYVVDRVELICNQTNVYS